MADLKDVAGAKLYIGGVLATKSTDFAATDYAAQTWVEIDGWETIGAYGDTSAEIVTTLINRARDMKNKGTRNGGNFENVFAILPADLGQIALIAAEKVADNYAFKILWNDQITPATGSATTQYLIALVASVQEQGGAANTVRKMKAILSVNSNLVTVAAT